MRLNAWPCSQPVARRSAPTTAECAHRERKESMGRVLVPGTGKAIRLGLQVICWGAAAASLAAAPGTPSRDLDQDASNCSEMLKGAWADSPQGLRCLDVLGEYHLSQTHLSAAASFLERSVSRREATFG